MGALKKAVLWLVALHIVAAAGYFLIYERFAPLDFISPWLQSNFLFWSWANFDGEHYLSVSKFGYQIRNGFPQYAFFPLLPILIKFASFIFQDYLISGLVVVFLALVAILWLLPRWVTTVGKTDPRLVELALLLAPGAVFLGSVYTEPVYIALALGVFYLSEKKKWLPASLLAALATASRINGIFVAIFLLVKYYQDNKSLLRSAFVFLISNLGLLSYMTYLYFRTGDALAFYHSQGAWGKATATSPIVTAMSYLRAITIEFVPDLTHLVVVFEVVLTLFSLYLVYLVIKKKLLSLPYQLFLLGNIGLPIITGSLGSMPRFFLLMFPAYIAIADMSRKWRLVVYTVFTIMFVTGVVLYTRGHWYA